MRRRRGGGGEEEMRAGCLDRRVKKTPTGTVLCLSLSLCLPLPSLRQCVPPSLPPSFPPSLPPLTLPPSFSQSSPANHSLPTGSSTHTHTHTHTCSEVTHTTCTLFFFFFFINILATAISIQRWSFGSDWWGERRKKHVKKRRCVKVCETECVFSSAATELKDYFNIFLFFIFIFFRGGMLAFFCESEMRKWTSASCRVCVVLYIAGLRVWLA